MLTNNISRLKDTLILLMKPLPDVRLFVGSNMKVALKSLVASMAEKTGNRKIVIILRVGTL